MYPSFKADDRPSGDGIETPNAANDATQENPVALGRNPNVGPNPLLEEVVAPSFWDLPHAAKFKFALRIQAIVIGLIIVFMYFFKTTETWRVMNIVNETLVSNGGHGFDVPRLETLLSHELPGTVVALCLWSLFVLCGYRGMTKRSTWRMSCFNCCTCCAIVNALFGLIFCIMALGILPEWVELATECDARTICMPDGKIAPGKMDETMACIDGSHPNQHGMVMPSQCKDLSHLFMKCPWDHHHYRHHRNLERNRRDTQEYMRLNHRDIERHEEFLPEYMFEHHRHHHNGVRIVHLFLNFHHGPPSFPPPPPMGPPPMRGVDGRPFYDAPPPMMGPMSHGPCPYSGSFGFSRPLHLMHLVAIDPYHMHHHAGHFHKLLHNITMHHPKFENIEYERPDKDVTNFGAPFEQLPGAVFEDEKVVDYTQERRLHASEYYCKVNVEAVNNFHIYVVAQPRLVKHVYLGLWVYLTVYCVALLVHSFGFCNGVRLRRSIKREARMLSLAGNDVSGRQEHAMYPMNEASRAVPLLTGQEASIV